MFEAAIWSLTPAVPLAATIILSSRRRMRLYLIFVTATMFLGTTPRVLYLERQVVFYDTPAWSLTLGHAIEYGIIALSVFSALFAVGYLLAMPHRGRKQLLDEYYGDDAVGEAERACVTRRFRILGVGAAVVNVAAIIVAIRLRFGRWDVSPWEIFYVSSLERTFEMLPGVAVNLSFLFALVPLSELVLVLGIWLYDQRVVARGEVWVLCIINVLCVVLPPILMGSRMGVLKPLILALLGVALRRGVTPTLAGGLVVGLITVIPLVVAQGKIRVGEWSAGGEWFDVGGAFTQFALWIAETGHFVAVERTGQILLYVLAGWNEFPFGGSIYLGLITFIPRILWPEKPSVHEGTFVNVALLGNEPTSGTPAGLVGGLLLNFGVLGAMMGALVYGYVVRRLDDVLIRSRCSASAYCYGLLFLFPTAFDLLQSSIAGFLSDGLIRVTLIAMGGRFVAGRKWRRLRNCLSGGMRGSRGAPALRMSGSNEIGKGAKYRIRC